MVCAKAIGKHSKRERRQTSGGNNLVFICRTDRSGSASIVAENDLIVKEFVRSLKMKDVDESYNNVGEIKK